MASITKRKNKQGYTVWTVRIRDKQNNISRTFTTLKEAVEFSENTQQQTVAQLIDLYINEAMNHKNPKTIKLQKPQLQYWRKALGHLSVKKCTAHDVIRARDALLRLGKKPPTANRYVQAISPVFTYAIDVLEWAQKHPVKAVKKYREQSRLRYLSPDEINRLLTVAKTTQYLYPIILIALTTGMRKGEIINLRWTDIDFTNRLVILHTTKNGDMRVINLSPTILEQLKELPKLSPYVFTGKTGHPYFLASSVWKNLLKQANIENFRFHDLRHTAASYLAMNGENAITIAEILGHKTLAMVQRYSHLSSEIRQKALDKLAKMWIK
ncbi:site-specific recombinase XerD [Beggiatoa alba B18LD]|uniref:Site-specific recombinase XerD n=1 Tax=Beggiatoa alba B18LD TaxID=395493 RepID=I3CK54_9GAMM|nr:site-specific integrase [Beggiatoa alba]EIJ43997.1 site-specific recombinase XerD [Beggiatoa alba B18LD]